MEKKSRHTPTSNILESRDAGLGMGGQANLAQDGADSQFKVKNWFRGVKARSPDHKEYVLYLSFETPPTQDEEFIVALSQILSNTRWLGINGDNLNEAITKMRSHGDGKIN